ncbi:MAG: hypothetical protein M3N93_06755 [Acidobacteriota bacterium]|nr:hypothetical protein [Acidobacteriota bacterium]
MRYNCLVLFSGLLCAGSLPGQALYNKPAKILGDPNFIGTASTPLTYDSVGPNVVEGRELNRPSGIALDTSASPPIVYIADTGNNRILAFRYQTQLTAGASADLILGQPDRFSTLTRGPGTSLTTGLNAPTGMTVDGSGNLYVADTGNNRILRYPAPFNQPAGYQFPDLIIGQTSFSSATANSGGESAASLSLAGPSFSHTGLALDAAGNLWVTDTGNSRVLRYPVGLLKAYQNGPAADTLIGQGTFTASTPATSRTVKTALAYPVSIAFDPTGRMLVADNLARVLVYAAGASGNATAIRITGVDASNSASVSAINIGSATGVAANAGNIFVVDATNSRVLVYGTVDTWQAESVQFSPLATGVMGQKDFTGSGANLGGLPGASSLNAPLDVAITGGELFVTDTSNNRVMVFPSASSGTSQAASRVIGQLDFPYNAPNLAEGKEFYLAGSSSGVSGSAVLDLNATPPHLYVADTLNNRILGFNDFTHLTAGQKADLVIGQPDFSSTAKNYPSNANGSPSQTSLNNPSGLALDSAGNLYVADTFNSRVLRFPAPFASGKTALESADLVIGQLDFTSIVTDTTARTLSAPVSLTFSHAGADTTQSAAGYLLVADANQSRVLLFPKPFSNGVMATREIGQPGFNSTITGSDAAHLTNPLAVAVDPLDRVLVADTGNHRIQAFDTIQNLPATYPGASFSITSSLTSPFSIGVAPSGQFWVADASANQLLHFSSIDQLPLKNYASDATQPADSPRSAFVDGFSNLLITDGLNRVLYFAPTLAAVNAANYISKRAVAPGTFAAVFPGVSTNVISSGTGVATSFPLPAALADTQVMVNGSPSPLLYVSPGQINLPLSLSLPTGGTVDLQVVRPSTGQIYGVTELSLNTASPGLFTIAGTGSGQVAAINVADGTVNSAKNPAARGQYVTIFGTGQGFVANGPADGQASSGPVPTATLPQILLGGAFVPGANIQYSGLAPSLAGVWQINFQIPATATVGAAVPLKVLMNSIPSDNPASPSDIAVTLSIK